MKRYYDYCDGDMHESADGEWVLYEDHCAEHQALMDQYMALKGEHQKLVDKSLLLICEVAELKLEHEKLKAHVGEPTPCPLETVQSAPPELAYRTPQDWMSSLVQCTCGWMGKASELKQPNHVDTRYRCPKCDKEFTAGRTKWRVMHHEWVVDVLADSEENAQKSARQALIDTVGYPDFVASRWDDE